MRWSPRRGLLCSACHVTPEQLIQAPTLVITQGEVGGLLFHIILGGCGLPHQQFSRTGSVVYRTNSHSLGLLHRRLSSYSTFVPFYSYRWGWAQSAWWNISRLCSKTAAQAVILPL